MRSFPAVSKLGLCRDREKRLSATLLLPVRLHTAKSATLELGKVDAKKRVIPRHPLLPDEIPFMWNSKPIISLLTGRRGHGKTLGMAAIGDVQMDIWKAHKVRRHILTNIWLEYAEKQGVIAFDQETEKEIRGCDPFLVDWIIEYFPNWLNQKLLLVDEIQSAISNRMSLSRINEGFSQFVTQIRKRQCDMVATTQFPHFLDKRYLWQVDLFVECEMWRTKRAVIRGEKGKLIWGREVKGGAAHIRQYVFDYWGQWTGLRMHKLWPPMVGQHDWERRFWNVHRMFGKYRTEEIVAPIHSSARERMLEEFWNIHEPREAKPDGAAILGNDAKLDSMLSRLNVFNIAAALTTAREKLERPDMDRQDFANWLMAHNYDVMQQGQITLAVKKQG